MDGAVGGLGDISSVTVNNSAAIAVSPSTSTPRLAPGLSSPTMANKMGSPVAASNAVPVTMSPNIKSVASTVSSNTNSSAALSQTSSPSVSIRPVNTGQTDTSKVLDKKRLQDLVKEVDPLEQLDDDVEDMLMQIADDFIDNVVTAACQLAKHRKSSTVEVKDVQLHLERNWNMWIPGFGSEDLKPYKKSATTEAHKQRLALIKKTLKKY